MMSSEKKHRVIKNNTIRELACDTPRKDPCHKAD